MRGLTIRPYMLKDYPDVKDLYKDSGWFDPETDAEDRLADKSVRDLQSLLVAIKNNKVVGTVSLIEDGRIALFFRLVVQRGKNEKDIRRLLIEEGEKVLLKKGYNEAHIIAPEEDTEKQKAYEHVGFEKGKPYRWMWKKL